MPDQAELVSAIALVVTLLAGIQRAWDQARKKKAKDAQATDEPEPEDRAKLDNAALWTLIDSLRATNRDQQDTIKEAHQTIEELRTYLDQANQRNDRLEGRMARLQAQVDQMKATP